jgi:hypothetical protein
MLNKLRILVLCLWKSHLVKLNINLQYDLTIFNGNWVVDGSDPIYPFSNDAFNCFINRRPDLDYLRYQWEPHWCHIPWSKDKFTQFPLIFIWSGLLLLLLLLLLYVMIFPYDLWFFYYMLYCVGLTGKNVAIKIKHRLLNECLRVW